MIIVIIRGRRPKTLLFSNNLRGISIAHTNEIYREDCCLEIVVEKIKEAAIPYFTSFAKQPFGFSFEFQMIWPMNREVFHSIFLGGLLLSFYVFGSVRIHHFNPFLSGARKPLQPSRSKINCDHSPLFPGVATRIQMSMTYSILASNTESHRR